MKAIILAAGRGRRLEGVTADLPKCLVEIGGKPLLQWQVDALREAAIREIAVVRGYRAEQVAPPGLIFFDNPRWAQTNMVMSLVCATEWLNAGPCIVSYSDIVYHTDTVLRLIESKGDIVLSSNTQWLDLWKRRFDDPLTDAETFRVDERGRLIEIGGRAKSLEEIQGQYMGLLKLTPAGWRSIEEHLAGMASAERDALDVTSLFRRLLKSGVVISTVAVDGRWYEIDQGRDLALVREAVERRNGGLWDA